MKFQTERQLQKNFLLKEGDYKSTKEVFERIARYIPNKNILAELDEHRNIVYYTAKELADAVENFGDGLLAMGLKNKHIAICADNSCRYIIADASISGGVGVVTPIDKDANPELLSTLLNRCDADAIIFSSYLVDKIKEVQKSCPKLQTLITIDKKLDGLPSFDEVIELGGKPENKKYKNMPIDLTTPAKILFTSGTTGANKPVILTQNNLAANIINCLDTIKADNKGINTSMSILPMHHATEINTHIMARIASGRLTYINGDMKNMMINIKIFKPSVITIVPMIANAFYRTIWANAKKAGKDTKLKKGIKLCKILNTFNIDLTHKLFKDVFSPFGGNLEQIVCGGAMLNPEVVQGLKDLGIFVINGYGITECGPLISMNADTIKETLSIGKPCPNLEVKIFETGENNVGELCVRGRSVSKGYYNDEENTKSVFDQDGFFHTGDLVKQDAEGKLFLVGRKKNVIILENGKNVCPEEIENLIETAMPYINDIVIYTAPRTINGQNREIICAGIYIEDPDLRDNQKLISDFGVLNSSLPPYKQIRFLNITTTPYEKTSTRKIKRNTVMDKHNNETGFAI